MSKKYFVDKIHNKIGKTISKLLIEDVIFEATEYIKEKIIKEGIYSLNNFGTFSRKNNRIRFIPNAILIRMIKAKRSRESKGE
jgi:nucleoid DNA-binding protein